ncbi:MAG: rod-binding protein [Devosiaceae bacterium]
MQSSSINQASAMLGPSAQSIQQMAAAAGGNREAIEASAEEFEAVMLSAMLKPIFENVEISEPFGGGEGERMWKGLLVEEYAKEMAATGGIGIADQVRAELLRVQEAMSEQSSAGTPAVDSVVQEQ